MKVTVAELRGMKVTVAEPRGMKVAVAGPVYGRALRCDSNRA